MKVFLKNIIIKKILIVFITIIMTSNFIMPNYAFAANDESGGVLFTPISSLILGIADRVLATVQEIFVVLKVLQTFLPIEKYLSL